MTLDELGLKHGTDKASSSHGYFDKYEFYFSRFREREFTLLEIGVAEGRSLCVWKEWFPNATIVGIDEVDNNTCCPSALTFIGDQADESFLASVIAKIEAPSIIIDDGGHKGHEAIKSFRYLFPRMKQGFYVVEDTHCFYSEHYAEDSRAFEYFSGKAKDVDVAGRGMTGNARRALSCPHGEQPLPEFSRELSSMHIHPSIWFFERR